VHFGLLDEGERPNAARSVVDWLREHGYTIKWCDPSHLVARTATAT
jgi:hypothetical protein